MYPITFTKLSVVTSFPGWVTSQLPPFSAARSTTTDPGFMSATCSALISFGAGLPGISAVVMTISTYSHCLANNFIYASMNSLLISFAYPPAPAPDYSIPFTSKNSAPRDSICSLAAGLTSNPLTMAPRFLAVAMAERPATPPPIIKTLAGGNLPAAVICPVKNLPKF